MTSAYWNQWSYAEIVSMHGVEMEEIDADLDQNEVDTDLSHQSCDCSNCMNCLGISWRDFM